MAVATVSAGNRNPPVDYAVAVWLGTPKADLARGLREGWIRAPAGVDVRSWSEQRGLGSEGGEVDIESPWPIVPPTPETSSPLAADNVATVESRARIEALLRRFDPGMDGATFERAWEEAGEDDATRSASFVAFVARSLNLPFESADAVEIAQLEEAAEAHAGRARFTRIAASTSRELETLAATDAAVRRALIEHSSWALAGDSSLARLGDAVGRYDRFDRDSGEQLLTDDWIADRAKHAAWRHALAAGRSPEIDGEGWRFVDRAAGDQATVEIAAAGHEPQHQVIFGRDDGDRVNGGAGTDRVHGGRGDDMLRGRAGDDLVEGGDGSDALDGGTGRDLLAGQQGDDEIDGGHGDDDLDGGSGDDELIGGRGHDRLRGGAGNDTYRFDDGDGEDTIEDDSGKLVIDDVTVAGTMSRNGEGWISSDGRLRFAVEGQGGERRLVVSMSSDDGSETAGTTVGIAAWRDGAFGISLEADDAAVELPPGDAGSGPPDHIHAGNEAPVGVSAAFIPPSPEGGVQQSVTSGNDQPASRDEHTLLDWPAVPQQDALSLVDVSDLASALDQWTVQPRVDAEHHAGAVHGVTSSDVGDAIATAAQDSEDGEGLGDVFPDSTSLPLPVRNPGLRMPPELSIRPSP